MPVSYQQTTSPYIKHIQNMTFGNKKMRFDQTKQTTEDIKVKFSQICSMKSMGSVWENLKIQLALKGLICFWTLGHGVIKRNHITKLCSFCWNIWSKREFIRRFHFLFLWAVSFKKMNRIKKMPKTLFLYLNNSNRKRKLPCFAGTIAKYVFNSFKQINV